MSRSDNNPAPTLMAMGLFVATALLSQILQAELERRRKQRETINFRSMYQSKRLSDRLSYHDLSTAINLPHHLQDSMDSLQVRAPDVSTNDKVDYRCDIILQC